MNKLTKSITNFLAVASVSLMPVITFAQGAADFPDIQPAKNVDIVTVLGNIVTFMLSIAGGIAVIYLIWAGIQYITGGAKGAENAKTAIVNAIIGVAVIMLAYIIVTAVTEAF